jgi:hypothetical protein
MIDRDSLQSGMTVRSVHGERLGHILALGPARFCIEKGLFFKKGFYAAYDEVKEIRNGEVILSLGRDRLLDQERDHSRDTGDPRVVHDRQTVRVPRRDQEIAATPEPASRLPRNFRERTHDDERPDERFTPTPVRPIREGGAIPSTPGPDGLWP